MTTKRVRNIHKTNTNKHTLETQAQYQTQPPFATNMQLVIGYTVSKKEN